MLIEPRASRTRQSDGATDSKTYFYVLYELECYCIVIPLLSALTLLCYCIVIAWLLLLHCYCVVPWSIITHGRSSINLFTSREPRRMNHASSIWCIASSPTLLSIVTRATLSVDDWLIAITNALHGNALATKTIEMCSKCDNNVITLRYQETMW